MYGFLNIMFKILEEEKPDYLTVAFDVHAPTFRHKMFDAYKGTRSPMDDALRQQVPMIKEMLTAMGVRIIEMKGYEADDLLGTLAGMGEREGMDVSVVSGDRDLLQLATEHVKIRIPKPKRPERKSKIILQKMSRHVIWSHQKNLSMSKHLWVIPRTTFRVFRALVKRQRQH